MSIDSTQPWLKEKKWSSNRIQSEFRQATFYLASVGSLLSAFGIGLLSQVDYTDLMEKGDGWAWYFLLAFPIASLPFWYFAFRNIIDRFRFGRSLLSLKPYPGSIGGHCAGSLTLDIPFDASQAISLKLSCVYSAMVRNGRKSERKESTIWAQEGFGYTHATHTSTTELNFCFDIPADLPESTLSGKNFHYWILTVKTEVHGKSMNRHYKIPMFKTAETSVDMAQYKAIKHPSNNSRALDRIETLEMEDDGHTITIIHNYLRGFLGNLLIALIGSLFFIAGIATWAYGAPIIFALFFCPIGGLYTALYVFKMINRYTVQVQPSYIQTKREILGLVKRTKKYSSSEINYISKSHSNEAHEEGINARIYFQLNAELKRGKTITLIEQVEGSKAAETLVKVLSNRLYGR